MLSVPLQRRLVVLSQCFLANYLRRGPKSRTDINHRRPAHPGPRCLPMSMRHVYCRPDKRSMYSPNHVPYLLSLSHDFALQPQLQKYVLLPDEHREVLLQRRNEAKSEFKGLFPTFQEDLKRLRKMVMRRK